jgi:hypothetical protein
MAEVIFTPDKSFMDRLNDVEGTLVKMDSKLEKIFDVVVGNETFDQVGLIGRLKKLEKESENNKALKNKLMGAFLMGGAIWTIIWELFKNIVKN